MANSMTADVHKATTWSIVLSVLMIVAGLLAIGVPLVAGVAVAALVAWVLVFGGALHLACVAQPAAGGGLANPAGLIQRLATFWRTAGRSGIADVRRRDLSLR